MKKYNLINMKTGQVSPIPTSRMDKNSLKRLRFWSKFHRNVTCWEAYCHLRDGIMTVSEKQNFRRFEIYHRQIQCYLIDYCGFKKSHKKRDNFIILEKDEPTPQEKRISRNYYDLLRSFVEEDFSI